MYNISVDVILTSLGVYSGLHGFGINSSFSSVFQESTSSSSVIVSDNYQYFASNSIFVPKM